MWGITFMVVLWAFFIMLAALLLPFIFYMLTLQKALSRCAPSSRVMDPGLVWLDVIPIFSLVWRFFIVINVAASLHNEFVRRGITQEPSPGQGVGLAMCILSICCWNPLFLFIPPFFPLCWIAWFVCWVSYWSKIAALSAMLAAPYEAPRPAVTA